MGSHGRRATAFLSLSPPSRDPFLPLLFRHAATTVATTTPRRSTPCTCRCPTFFSLRPCSPPRLQGFVRRSHRIPPTRSNGTGEFDEELDGSNSIMRRTIIRRTVDGVTTEEVVEESGNGAAEEEEEFEAY